MHGIQSDLLTRAEIEALVDRYGTAISFDTSEGSHPERLSSADLDDRPVLEDPPSRLLAPSP